MISGWLSAAADEFWLLAGGSAPFPRDLGRPLAYALPVSQVLLDRLAVAGIEKWLERRGIDYSFEAPSRPLRGCLVAVRGQGLIFLDGTDPAAEQRFTLAHEIAHYLLDYHGKREAAIRRLGEGIIPVLDGERPPTQTERIDAALAAAPMAFYVHLFDRRRADAVVDAAERRADLLAYELLAPDEELGARFGPGTSETDVAEILTREFGFPQSEATAYARHWLRANRPAPSHLSWLRQ